MPDDFHEDDLVELTATLEYQTAAAGLFRIEGVGKVWLPWSQVDSKEVEKDKDHGRIYIPRWLAEQKQLV